MVLKDPFHFYVEEAEKLGVRLMDLNHDKPLLCTSVEPPNDGQVGRIKVFRYHVPGVFYKSKVIEGRFLTASNRNVLDMKKIEKLSGIRDLSDYLENEHVFSLSEEKGGYVKIAVKNHLIVASHPFLNGIDKAKYKVGENYENACLEMLMLWNGNLVENGE